MRGLWFAVTREAGPVPPSSKMTEIRIQVWIDGEEIELSSMIRHAIEKHVQKSKKSDAVPTT